MCKRPVARASSWKKKKSVVGFTQQERDQKTNKHMDSTNEICHTVVSI